MKTNQTNVTIMRAGTSKGIFIKQTDLPTDQTERDARILRIFGSPDIRQIDGLGGADPLTSKLAIVGAPTLDGADVDYTFGQVSYVAPKVDYSGNCGNISSGVGAYAIDKGFVKAESPYTTVRIHNTNTGKILIEKVRVEDGKPKYHGDYVIDGVPGTGEKIEIDFSNTWGSKTGKLLPTGNVIDQLDIKGLGLINCSIVDAANPMVFVKAADLSLSGTEEPAQIDKDKLICDQLEAIRGAAAVLIGMAESPAEALKNSPAFPMIAFVSEAADYVDFTTGNKIANSDVDFISRLMFMQVMHKAYAGTGTICTGAAARIEGTVVNQVMMAKQRGKSETLRIGHPSGIIEIKVAAEQKSGKWQLLKAVIYRTARKILDGVCYTD